MVHRQTIAQKSLLQNSLNELYKKLLLLTQETLCKGLITSQPKAHCGYHRVASMACAKPLLVALRDENLLPATLREP